MNLTLHPNLSGPLYQQVFESLRQDILAGHLACDARLPSTRALAQQMGISRNTVNIAYEMLQAEGYIVAKRGSGFFVADQPAKLLQVADVGLDKPKNKKKRQPFSERGLRMTKLPFDVYNYIRNTAFLPGLPDITAFPYKKWLSCMPQQAHREETELLFYQQGYGYKPLRVALADYLKAHRGVSASCDQIVITAGSQSGLDWLARVLTDEGDRVAIESPGYLGARDAFLAAGVSLSPIDVDAEGLRVDKLEKAHSKQPVKLVFTTPSSQYPSGVTMSLKRRLALLQWAEQNDVYVIEDDYDSEFRYQGRPISCMQGLNPDQVIYMGTFSKVMFPGLRIGYLVLPEQLAKPMAANLYATGHETSLLLQASLAEFIDRGYFLSHLRKMRKLYSNKQQLFISLANKHLSRWLTCEARPAGMQLVCYYKHEVDELKVARLAAESGLTLLPLTPFFFKKPAKRGLFIGYTSSPLDEIESNVLLLKRILKKVDGLRG